MGVIDHKFLKIRRTLIDVSCVESKREGILLYRPGRWWQRWIPVVMSWFAWLPWPGRKLSDFGLIDCLIWERIEKTIGACRFVTIYLGNGSEKSKLTIKARLEKELTDCRIDRLTDCEGGELTDCRIDRLTDCEGGELTDCRIDGLTDCGGAECVIVKLGNTAAASAAIRNEVRVLKLLHEKSIGQSVNSPIRQSVNSSSGPSIDRLTDCQIDRLSSSDQSVNQSICQSVNSPIRQSVNLSLQIPRVIGDVGSIGNWTWSVQTVLPRGRSPNRLQKEHYEFLEKLKEVGVSHGDFAPWNCAIVKRSSLRSSSCRVNQSVNPSRRSSIDRLTDCRIDRLSPCHQSDNRSISQSVNSSIGQSDNVLVVWDWEDAGPWVEGKDEGWFRKQVKELLGVEEKKV